jgi:pyridinium-3,5-bisthiocarboxylic acid mononucleotide nickel chelatase
MTKRLYFDCPTGVAGDMCLGALVHAGVPMDYLVEKLSLLGLEGEFTLRSQPVHRNGQAATKIYVDIPGDTEPERLRAEASFHKDHSHAQGHVHNEDEGELSYADSMHTRGRHLPEIEGLIRNAGLPKQAEVWSLDVFQKLAEAEGAVHGIAPEAVHFHEVGAIDAIVDIVGTCIGLDWLEPDEIYCSALPTGGGIVRTAHGQLPVPTPAVVKLWEFRQVPIYSNGIQRELVTPTGAALMVTLAKGFGPPPSMSIHQIGLGAGSRDLPIPNILRLWIGEAAAVEYATVTPELEVITVLETQIDDLNPQAIAYTQDQLFTAGALDVFTQPIGMKKSRLGTLLTVICYPEQVTACEMVIFQETSTLGIRRSQQHRSILSREMQTVQTLYGPVRVKVAWSPVQPDVMLNVQPEYDDCAQIAHQHQCPWREVHRLALEAWYIQRSQRPSSTSF